MDASINPDAELLRAKLEYGVWREGFDDWKPAQDIEELVQAIMNPGAGGGGAAAAISEAVQEGSNPYRPPAAATTDPEAAKRARCEALMHWS